MLYLDIQQSRIVKYSPAQHEPLLRAWLAAREMNVTDLGQLSPTGYVVDNAAIGFLIETNGGQAYLDRFITKPGLARLERQRLFSDLIQALETKAKRGVWLSALVASEGLHEAFTQAGYAPIGEYTLYTKKSK